MTTMQKMTKQVSKTVQQRSSNGTKRPRSRMGCFPNLQTLRIQAGLEIHDLVAALPDGPKERSLRRLEEGRSIRLAGAFRVFHVINKKVGGLDHKIEVVEE
jgi:hypothetical protein